jgi:DNA polymerase III subunit epsilon
MHLNLVGLKMDNDDLIKTLEDTGDFRVLQRLNPSTFYNQPDESEIKLAIFLDLETTGLDHEKDEIIELAMIPFDYSIGGKIYKVHDAFDELQEPLNGLIPNEITNITGITNDMVKNKKINVDKVNEIAGSADLIIAHNANFDRKFAEKAYDVFSTKAWACSMSQIPWREETFESMKLEYLAMKSGFFFDGHRAAVDCQAGIELLSRSLPQSGNLAFQVLLDQARKTTCRIWAERAPFDFKDLLKARGYRWNPGNDGNPKAWYIDVLKDDLDEEISYLRKDIYQKNVDVPIVKITAYDRFSARI